MEAVVKYGRRDGEVELRDIAWPPPLPPDRVLLEVKAVGVCGSDIHLWHEKQSWPIKVPLVLGHEFCGVVAEVGPAVTGWQPGDRVACETAAEVCGRCVYCMTGNYNLCPYRKGYGNLIDGAMTRHVIARPHILHRIPGNVSFEQAAMAEPICVAYNALVEKTLIKPGDLTVIQGAGAIGLMALQVARLRGAWPIVVIGTPRSPRRLEVARQLGATHTATAGQDDLVALVRSLGDGFGADVVVDCTGASAAIEIALQMVRPNGRITKIGWGREPLGYNLDPMVGKAVTLQGSFSHTYTTWERVLGLLGAGQIDLKPVIGGVYPLARWQDAFEDMQQGTNVKSVLSVS